MDFDKDEFARLLNLAKGDRSINQYGLHSGVSAAHISRLMRGLLNTPPNPDTIKRLVNKAYNDVSYRELMQVAGHFSESEDVYDSLENNVDNLTLLSERLRKHLGDNNLEIQKIADHCGVTQSYIDKLMTNPTSLPGVGTLYKLADYLKVTPDYLSGYASDPEGHNSNTPRPRDMQDFLAKEEVMLYGEVLDDEDKEKLNNILAAVFLDAKKKNKRK